MTVPISADLMFHRPNGDGYGAKAHVGKCMSYIPRLSLHQTVSRTMVGEVQGKAVPWWWLNLCVCILCRTQELTSGTSLQGRL